MTFDLQKALENDGKCRVVQHMHGCSTPQGRYRARIICSDRLNNVEGKRIIVLYEFDNTEHIAEFDKNGVFCNIQHGKKRSLENLPEKVDVWVVAYRNKNRGTIQTSTKFSKDSLEDTYRTLQDMGHTFIGVNKMTITEGEDNV